MTPIGQAIQAGLKMAFYPDPFYTIRERRLQSILAGRIESKLGAPRIDAVAAYSRVKKQNVPLSCPPLGTTKSVRIGAVQEEVRPFKYVPPLSSCIASKSKNDQVPIFDIAVLKAGDQRPVPLTIGGQCGGDVIRWIPLDNIAAIVEVKAGPFPAIKDEVGSDLARLVNLSNRAECHFVFADKSAPLFCNAIGIAAKVGASQLPAWDDHLAGNWTALANQLGCKFKPVHLCLPGATCCVNPPHVTLHVCGATGPVAFCLPA